MGEAPGWVGAVLGLAALLVSLRSLRYGRRSADAARDAVVEARRSGVAAERSAAAAEGALADRRNEVAERRAAEEEARRPRARLRIEHRTKAVWELVNHGDADAGNVRCLDASGAREEWPEGLTIPAGHAHQFMMVGCMSAPVPSVLRVVWDGQEEPVPLRVPPRSG
ncbi:hypothetical protein [Streptomyces sp. NPDC012888]|uniref:hypothetical protein n=1 Tax=Streptomyces sp. NPDC012888 TaxID=3364855 RepID=UPI00369B01C9